MEERFHPPPPPPPIFIATDDVDRQTSIPTPPHQRLYRIDDDNVALQLFFPSTSKGHNDTYIVQMPKDQIYWVPPPENAAIIAQHRPSPQKTRRRCTPCAWYIASTLFAVVVLVVTSFLIYKLTLTPHNPLFEIKSFSVKDYPNPNPKSSTHHAPPTYHVGMQATNPNSANSLAHMAGSVELHLYKKEVARGHTSALAQAPNEIDDYEVLLVGRAGEVPKAIQRSVDPTLDNKKGGRSGVKLSLTMSFAMKKITWLMVKRDLAIVKCEFEVEPIAHQKGSTTVTSQTCDYI